MLSGDNPVRSAARWQGYTERRIAFTNIVKIFLERVMVCKRNRKVKIVYGKLKGDFW